MNALNVTAIPPVSLARLRAATRAAVADREHREAVAMQEARVVLTRLIEKPKPSPATANLTAARRRLDGMKSDAAARVVKRAQSNLAVMKFPAGEQRDAARALYRIIDG